MQRVSVIQSRIRVRLCAYLWNVPLQQSAHKTGHSYRGFHGRQKNSFRIIPPEHRVLGSPFLTSWRRKRLQNVVDKSSVLSISIYLQIQVSLSFSCSEWIIWCVSLVFVSQTSWCLAGSECRMFHPRHSTGLWQGSTQHRPSHTHCSGEGEPGQCLCLIPDTAVAVKTQSGGTYFKRGFQDFVLNQTSFLRLW